MRTLSLSLALPLLFAGVSGQEKTTPEKSLPEASALLDRQTEKKVEKEVPTGSQDTSSPSVKDVAIAHGKFILKNGALYLRLSGALIPLPGGGASGCFGYPPQKASEGEKPPPAEPKEVPGD